MSYEARYFDYTHQNCPEYVVEVIDETREVTVKIHSVNNPKHHSEFAAKLNSSYEEVTRGSKIITCRKMVVNEIHFPDDDTIKTYDKLMRAAMRRNTTPAWAKQALTSTIKSLEAVLNAQSNNSEA